jgi:amino acid permease
MHNADNLSTSVVYFNMKGSFLLSTSLIAVSFFCHFNMLPIHFEVRRPTKKRVNNVCINLRSCIVLKMFSLSRNL